MSRGMLILYLSVAVIACMVFAAIYHTPYYPEGWEIYAKHFRSLPEVERFYSVFPDARPERTLMYTYPVGYVAHDGHIRIEMGIFHDRFSFEPNEIIVRCSSEPGYIIADEIMDHVKTEYCGEGYQDGFEPYTDAFAELDEVRAFLESYPDAQPGFTPEYTPGFTAMDGDVRVELAIYHEPGSFEPDKIRVMCFPPDDNGTRYKIKYSTREPFLTKPYCEE